jgi:oligoendopeptidase F
MVCDRLRRANDQRVIDQVFSHFVWRVITAFLCVTVYSIAVAQEQNDAFRAIAPSEVNRYHIDFTRFFASPGVERADRAKLYSILKELESLKGKTTTSAENLERALRLNDQAQIEFYRHYAYLYLRNAVNTTDEESLKQSSALDSEVTARTTFLRHELMLMPERQFASFLARKPSLSAYRFTVESARRYRPFTLSLKEEELLSSTAPNNDWASELYDKLIAQPQATALQRELLAFILTRLASARTRLAGLHRFPDAATEAYFNSYWTKAEVDSLLGRIAQKADLYKRYQRMRAEYVATQSSKSTNTPHFTIDQATEILRNALKPLGPDYERELSSLLDPANGRIDIVPGKNRRRGGFSRGFIGSDSVFYSAGFAGSYNDLRILTHESTHAIHRQLMNRNGVLPPYAEGPHFLFEAIAIFNEFLLPDYLYRHSTDPLLQRFYLERFLEGKGLVIFTVAPEVVVEHGVYEGIENGHIKDPDDLDQLSQKAFATYWWSNKTDEFKTRWMNISLMYEDPFYDTNYIYGSLLALNFYAMYLRDPERFVPRYIGLMKNGFDAPPSILLHRFLDLDLNDPSLISNALSLIEERIDLLEKNYQPVK